jgi:hypothetical protein
VSFHRLCLVHVQIEAVWLVLGARGDVSRRVITCIGWDGFIEDVLWSVTGLLINEKNILTETLFFVFINSFLLYFFYPIFYRKYQINFGLLFILGCNIKNKILSKSRNNIVIFNS